MTKVTRRPLRRRAQARLMRIINVPMRLVLGLPVGTPLGGRLMLAFITGRKTGKLYRQPLSYVRQGDTLLTPGGGRWKLNLTHDRPVRLRIRGRDQFAMPEIIRDPAEVESLLDTMAAVNPAVNRFVGVPRDAQGRLDQDRLGLAIRYGFGIVRWHPS